MALRAGIGAGATPEGEPRDFQAVSKAGSIVPVVRISGMVIGREVVPVVAGCGIEAAIESRLEKGVGRRCAGGLGQRNG